MENIVGTYQILDDGEKAGELSVKQQGMTLVFEAFCVTLRAGPFRLAVLGDKGQIPLGVMLPDGSFAENTYEGKRYTFKKAYSKNALSELGIKDISDCTLVSEGSSEPERKESVREDEVITEEAVGSENRWESENEPWTLFNDMELSETCRTVTGCLRRKEDGGVISFAVPIKRDAPFPAMPIFCFGTWIKINGANYVAFKIKDGVLFE